MTWLATSAWLVLAAFSAVAPASEFNRAIGLEVAVAVATSLGVAISVLVLTALLASIAGLAVVGRGHSRLYTIASACADVVDSVPSVLWILAIVIVVDEPRRIAAIATFIVVCLPSSIRVVTAECARQSSAPYLLSARAIGASRLRQFFVHLAPNAASTWGPFSAQLFGNAIAIDGAIGLLGAANRSDLNLGMLLLRGKEQVMFSPWLLGLGILSYVAIFTTLYAVADRTHTRRRVPLLSDFSPRA